MARSAALAPYTANAAESLRLYAILPGEGPNGRRQATALLWVGLSLAAGLFVWPAFAHAVEVWSTVDEFSYGFLIPPVAALLLWWRRAVVRASRGPGAEGGLPFVLAAVALSLLAARTGVHALAGLAVSPLLWGITVYLWGWRTGRVVAFPIGFLAFGLGAYSGLLNSAGFAMQSLTAVGAELLGRGLGLAVTREGLVLRSEAWAFQVAEACSGMSSLLALLALAALLAYVAGASAPARAVVLASVAPLVLLANTVRVTLVLAVASRFGQDAAEGFFHGASSLVLFGCALGGLVLVGRMAGCKLPDLSA